MRRVPAPNARAALLGLATLAALATAPGPARAQVPQPHIGDINQRSGLLQRNRMLKTDLPQDPHRDTFYGSRFGDRGKILDTNTFYDGGLYGVRLPARDTASVYPFFLGSPGRSTITEESRPWRPSCLRAIQQLTHQRKPVGMYYDRGSYVPIYDLDSFTPGPGTDYFPFYFQGSRGG